MPVNTIKHHKVVPAKVVPIFGVSNGVSGENQKQPVNTIKQAATPSSPLGAI